MPEPRRISDEPGVADEGELVRLEGDVVDVQRLGDRWRAEVRTSRAVVVVAGLAGAGIPSATLIEGGRATVTGIVRRPHPAATDRRFAVAPREPADIRAASPPAGSATTGGSATAAAPDASRRPPGIAEPATSAGDVPDADLAGLADRLGRTVRVGGLVLTATETGVTIDDGTATGELRLVGEAAAIRTLLEPGDAVSATGRVVAGATGPAVEVADPADLVRLGDLGEALPIVPASAAGAVEDPDDADRAAGPGATPELPERLAAGGLADGLGRHAASGPSATAGAGLALLVALAAVVVIAVLTGRRLRDRRRIAGRIATRLGALAGPAQGFGLAGSPGHVRAEHDASVRDPA